jgi:hypothetical protein
MSILDGLNRFLTFINDNWTSILVLLGLAIGLYKKIADYLSKTTDEKIEIAKVQIKQGMLKMITEAEIDFENWNKAGEIKRSQVIAKIYAQYPILSRVVDQDQLIEWIDAEINNSLKTLRVIVKDNKAE